MICAGGCGSLQTGCFNGKMIVVAALMDESAFPWQADWYRQRVKDNFGDKEEEHFRLWYMDHALHDDQPATIDETHLISYLGSLHQALLDLADWVERDIAPAPTSSYTVMDGQVSIPETAAHRKGIQPVAHLTVNGGEAAIVNTGETAHFIATAETTVGKLVSIEWNFDEQQGYSIQSGFTISNTEKTKATVEADYTYTKPGTYFPVVRIKAQRNADASDIFTQTKNLCRVRVVVK